jgi:hypothetical protein
MRELAGKTVRRDPGGDGQSGGAREMTIEASVRAAGAGRHGEEARLRRLEP